MACMQSPIRSWLPTLSVSIAALFLSAGCASSRVPAPDPPTTHAAIPSLTTSVEALASRWTNGGRRRAIEKRAAALGLSEALRTEWIDPWSAQRNVVLELPGTGAGLVYVVAHYDKTDVNPLKFASLLVNGLLDPLIDPFTLSQGAIDNATGVSLALELAARLQSRDRTLTWRVLLTGSEESGLRGARAHVARLSAEAKRAIVLAINIDTVGVDFSDDCVTQDLSDPDWAERTVEVARVAGIPLRTTPLPTGAATDVLPFQRNHFWLDFGRSLAFNLAGGLLPQRSWFTGAHEAPTLNLSACEVLDVGDYLAGTILLPVGRIHGPRDRATRVDVAKLADLLAVLEGLADALESDAQH
jgi:hypothetical protein